MTTCTWEAHAMDRRTRRYVPSSEGLEGRQMLSTATAANPQATALQTGAGNNGGTSAIAATQIDGQSPMSDTIRDKLQHIQNYPYFIGLLNRDGFVPQPAVANIQANLYAMVGTLHQGDTNAVHQFNIDLRDAQKTYNILPQQAARLNRDFGAVLQSAGAAPQLTANLQNELNSLAVAATHQPTPSIVVRNEYATTLQLALGIGRPLLAPVRPKLTSASRVGAIDKLDATNNAQPTLTGTYAAGVNIQIVDANNTVFGTGTTDANGTYNVKFANALPNGTYTVRVRAQDQGYYSPPSRTYTFVVKLKTPKITSTTTN